MRTKLLALVFGLCPFAAATPARADPATTAVVHVEAPGDATLERKVGDDWAPVCGAPCDKEVAVGPDALYRIRTGSTWVKNSRPFIIPARGVAGGRVDLRFSGWSTLFIPAGALTMVTGVGFLLGAGAVGLSNAGCDCPPNKNGEVLFDAGLGALGAGLVLILVGALGQSSISEPAFTLASARAPSYREAPVEAKLAPRALTLPVLTLKF